MLKGDTSSDFKLEDGDTIFIPFIENTVKLSGPFKRPDLYEFLEGETLEDAIYLGGGFKSGVSNSPKLEVNSIDRAEGKRRNMYFSNVQSFKDYLLANGDSINISEISGLASEVIEISGEVANPGSYSILKGDTILDIIDRAGGYTEYSYSEGAVFLREDVAKQQKEAFERSADGLEKTVVEMVSMGVIKAEVTEFTFLPVTKLVQRLRKEEPIGRQVIELDYLRLKTDPYLNFAVRDGDKVFIPKRPSSVAIVGEVINSANIRFDPSLSVEDYIEMSGGLNSQADKNKIYIIEPNGKAQLLKRKFFSQNSSPLPGSTIVVERQTRPLDTVALTAIITPILADLATSAAAIAAISD
jgi:protein involved in polysaccharide export with SLBB domain